ncbi:MAG: ABC transporter permease [Clostridia bacterium]|nr:ABC transporter permease [Clostridia bacterium]
MLAIFKREVKAYFYSPVAYVLAGFFILLSSIFFLSNLGAQMADFNWNLSNMTVLLLFIIPILTMRILAEDRKNGTEVLLVTSPSSLTGIVVGKYLASLVVFLAMVGLTFIYQIILFSFGKPDVPPLIGGYIGFILLGAAMVAVGVFASSLTENQVISAVVGFVSLLIMWLVDGVASFVGGIPAKILSWFSILSRFDDFSKGILKLSPIVYYISFIAVFLFLTIRIIDKRRWSQG